MHHNLGDTELTREVLDFCSVIISLVCLKSPPSYSMLFYITFFIVFCYLRFAYWNFKNELNLN